MPAVDYKSRLAVATRRTLQAMLTFGALWGSQSHAEWQPQGTPICTTAVTGLTAEGYGATGIADGAGGILFAWMDDRNFENTRSDIYAQRFTAAGVISVGWPAEGLPICTAEWYQGEQSVASDGVGGVIISWDDTRNGLPNMDIYALRLTQEGQIAAGWPLQGAVVCGAYYFQSYPRIIPDGESGAFIVWEDDRNFFSGNSTDIYMQRITGDGIPAPGWPLDGVAVCDTIESQLDPIIVSDGSGGVIVAWRDYRADVDGDLYALRLTASGRIASGWPRRGMPVCAAHGYQDFAIPTPRQNMVADGFGGAILAWQDRRSGYDDLYSQRITGSGSVAPGWPVDGLAVCTAPGDQIYPAVLADGEGGAIIAWQDGRSSYDIYAQHVTGAGAIASGWPADGLGVCTGIGNSNQLNPVIASDATGGALIAWEDGRNGLLDIYAQRLAPQGSITSGWVPNGLPVCTADSTQDAISVVPDGSGGWIFLWEDERNGYPPDIYASRLGSNGQVVTDVARLGDKTVTASVWPNPFSREIRMQVVGIQGQRLSVDVFDVRGRLVRSLVRNSAWRDGTVIPWNGQSEQGAPVPAGVYFLRVCWPGSETREKVLLVR